MAYRAPEIAEGDTTVLPEDPPSLPITHTQRDVLVALCRPLRDNPYATPATNARISSEIHLGVDAIKVHLRSLYRRMGIASLPQNEKRARLAELAIHRGLIDEKELDG